MFGITTLPRPLNDLPGRPPRALIQDRTRDSGAAWVRYGHLNWAAVEPTEGHIRWPALAAIEKDLAGLSARGLKVQVTLFGTPAWARVQADSFCGPIKPVKYAAFARFAGQMVNHFKQAPYNVRKWEV